MIAILGMVMLCGVSACLSSAAARVWRTNAPWAYGPMGLVVWSAFVRWLDECECRHSGIDQDPRGRACGGRG